MCAKLCMIFVIISVRLISKFCILQDYLSLISKIFLYLFIIVILFSYYIINFDYHQYKPKFVNKKLQTNVLFYHIGQLKKESDKIIYNGYTR